MAQEIIRFESVTKEYADGSSMLQVLDGVSFSIEKGEFVVIGGPSGAGKSTILNLAGGMESPSSGQIFIDGEDISQYSASQLTAFRAKTIGFIFQFYNLIPNLTALENIIFGSEVKDDTFDPYTILKKVGMTHRSKAFPPTMSGGEQQRIAIARAIAKNPKVLFCDEPTGALDYKTSKQVLEIIETLNREMGMTVVLVTHNNVLRHMADRYIAVHNGRISSAEQNRQKGRVSELEW